METSLQDKKKNFWLGSVIASHPYLSTYPVFMAVSANKFLLFA